jgi:hypothetical protein
MKKKKVLIERKELVYASIGIIFILVWFLKLRIFIAPLLEKLHPFIAMLIFNSGLFLGLYLLSGILNGKKIMLKGTLITFCVLLGVDILYAPYLVSEAGTIINSNLDYWYVSTDVGFGSLYASFVPSVPVFGLNSIWALTYIVTPALLMLIVPIVVLSSRKIAQIFGHH